MKHLIPFILIIIFQSGCKDSFSPNGSYEQKLIVYSVLDASVDTQYVRVLSTYNPKEYNPVGPSPNKDVANASVVMSIGTTNYIFHDTIISSSSSSGTVSPIRVYVNYKVPIQKEKKYTLTVSAAGFPKIDAFTETLVPGDVYATNSSLFIKSETATVIPISVTMGYNARAYLLTMQIEYDYQNGSSWSTEIVEVPSGILKNADGVVTQKFFPKVAFRTSGSGVTGRDEILNFETAAYKLTIQEIRDKYPNSVVKFRWIHLNLQQFDTELYSYYSVTNNFLDATTLRLDEPDYTNIKNGFGIFGNLTKITHKYYVPPDL